VHENEHAGNGRESSLELMCGTLQDGVILCRLLNYFLDGRKIDVWTEGGGGLISGSLQMATGLATDAVDIAGATDCLTD
jgi:hypothetical protein